MSTEPQTTDHGAILIAGQIFNTENLAKLVTNANDEQLVLLRDHGDPRTIHAAQREIVKRLGRKLRTYHSDALGAVTIPED